MTKNSESEDRIILLQIQNNQKPYEMIHLVWDKKRNSFETEGLRDLFGVKEIRIESKDLLRSLERYGHVLSFLLETMSAAEDYNLPYAYQNEFEFGNEKYTLHEEGEYRILKKLGEEEDLPLHL
ncbi:MAG: hypothetical protein WCA08_08125 [Desulfoferrobacter sp.]